jgi:hypothetical protein
MFRCSSTRSARTAASCSRARANSSSTLGSRSPWPGAPRCSSSCRSPSRRRAASVWHRPPTSGSTAASIRGSTIRASSRRARSATTSRPTSSATCVSSCRSVISSPSGASSGSAPAGTGGILNASNLANDVGISHVTVREWLSVLEASYVLFRLPPYFANVGKRFGSSRRSSTSTMSVSRPTSAASKTRARSRPTRSAEPSSRTCASSKRSSSARIEGQRARFFFYRDSSGTEIDLLAQLRRPLGCDRDQVRGDLEWQVLRLAWARGRPARRTRARAHPRLRWRASSAPRRSARRASRGPRPRRSARSMRHLRRARFERITSAARARRRYRVSWAAAGISCAFSRPSSPTICSQDLRRTRIARGGEQGRRDGTRRGRCGSG